MTVKLKLPPGFFHNGTEYQATGRWHRGNLVRWVKGALKPMNGWRRKFDINTETPIPQVWTDVDEAPRGGIAFTRNAASAVDLLIGTNKHIFLVTQGGDIQDVTPEDFLAQSRDAAPNTGYSSLTYDFTSYGISRPGSIERIEPVFTWGFTTWGFWPIAVARGEPYPVYIKTASDTGFVEIINSPNGAFDALVTDERFLMTFGKVTDHLLVEWSDRESYDVWTPLATNEAGSYRLVGNGRLVRGVTTRNRTLILGEVDAFVGQYVGPPYVYGFDRIAENCGVVAANAVASTEKFAVWLGQNGFWIYDGEVSELPCEVYGYFEADVDPIQISKTVAFTLTAFSEIWFLYQSKESATNEHDSYLVYNFAIDKWYFGKLDRSFGMDAGIIRYPLMVTYDGYIYDHEVTKIKRGAQVAYIESGPLEANNGQTLLGFQWVYPDVEADLDAITMRLSVRDMPNMDERFALDFELNNPVSTTGIMGRAITMRLTDTGNVPEWTVGDFRVEPVKQRGPQR